MGRFSSAEVEMLLLALLVASVAAYRCPIDGKKYTKYVNGATVKECPSWSIDEDDGRCRNPNTGRYVAKTNKRCCLHGKAFRTRSGKKYIMRYNANGNGQFCDQVSWAKLMRHDLTRTGVQGWDMNPLKRHMENVGGYDELEEANHVALPTCTRRRLALSAPAPTKPL